MPCGKCQSYVLVTVVEVEVEVVALVGEEGNLGEDEAGGYARTGDAPL